MSTRPAPNRFCAQLGEIDAAHGEEDADVGDDHGERPRGASGARRFSTEPMSTTIAG